jgi:hypothetical protein
VYCAGADAFLAHPVDTALALVHRNCVVPVQLCHHFAASMTARGSGGIIVVSSMGVARRRTERRCVSRQQGVRPGVHRVALDRVASAWRGRVQPRAGETDTPALRRHRAQRCEAIDLGASLPGAATVDEVVIDALEHLAHGASWIVGEHLRDAAKVLGSVSRSEAVALVTQAAAATMGNGTPEQAP